MQASGINLNQAAETLAAFVHMEDERLGRPYITAYLARGVAQLGLHQVLKRTPDNRYQDSAHAGVSRLTYSRPLKRGMVGTGDVVENDGTAELHDIGHLMTPWLMKRSVSSTSKTQPHALFPIC